MRWTHRAVETNFDQRTIRSALGASAEPRRSPNWRRLYIRTACQYGLIGRPRYRSCNRPLQRPIGPPRRRAPPVTPVAARRAAFRDGAYDGDAPGARAASRSARRLIEEFGDQVMADVVLLPRVGRGTSTTPALAPITCESGAIWWSRRSSRRAQGPALAVLGSGWFPRLSRRCTYPGRIGDRSRQLSPSGSAVRPRQDKRRLRGE
jgi:hypothetical protein